MAEASPICRGKNLTVETILAFVNAMPIHQMKKSEFHDYTEKRLKGWTQTHSQIARQVALYYESDGICYPRFTKKVSYSEVLRYVTNWAKLYFVPNLYTPSLNDAEHRATNIYAYLKNQVLLGETSFSTACTSMFGIELNNTDKVRVYLNNFTDLVISDDTITNNFNITSEETPDIYPDVENFDSKKYFEYFKVKDADMKSSKKQTLDYTIQQINYGAPGTGKSFAIKDIIKVYSTIRTTFHPDSDYSTFVGAYKPVMQKVDLRDLSGHIVEGVQEDRIVYTYVKQAFLKAYLGAWQKYAKGDETAEPQFLVIEEINRGNCAQIFGDLFQLLDRSDNGFSTYPIEADSDLQNEIREAFTEGGEYALENELDVDDAVEGYTSNYGKTLSDDIKNGRVLLLPNNFYIWATMNTSDQSLFPIDSAFKRRWDWRYVKIADAGKGWKIKCGIEYCDWWTFIEEINKKIAQETSSDDKKLGYFFCKPPKDSDTITEEKFVGKVLFYLWNDVFKDGDISLFKVSDEPEAEICFDAFYGSDNNVNVEAIRKFLVGVVGEENIKKKEELEEAKDNDDKIVEDEDGNSATSSSRNFDKFTINDGPECAKNKLAFECIKEYVRQNPDISAQEVYDTWSSLGKLVSHFIETKEEFDVRKDNSKQRSQAIECHGTTLYVACDGYGDNGKADLLMNLVNEKDWGLTIKKIVK